MRAWWALLVALSMLLAGCGGKDKLSDAEMEERAEEALAQLRADVGPRGDLAAADISGLVKIDVEGPFGGPVTAQLRVDAQAVFGDASDIRVDGSIADIEFQTYCSPERLVAVTNGLERYDERDADTESRNLNDVCAGPGSEGLLASVGEFELIDPDIITGNLYHDELDLLGLEQTGDGRFDATYSNQGPLGATNITVSVKGTQVQKILTSNPDSRITMELEYGDRGPIEAPEPERRVPTEVIGTEQVTDDGWRWQGTTRESGPWDEYIIHVFEPGTDIECGSSGEPPVVAFDLAEGKDQEKDGWRMTLVEDGDGTLGPGDTIFLRHPGSVGQDWDFDVEFYDTWASSYATFTCSIPGPGVLPLVGILALAPVALRRRWP